MIILNIFILLKSYYFWRVGSKIFFVTQTKKYDDILRIILCKFVELFQLLKKKLLN